MRGALTVECEKDGYQLGRTTLEPAIDDHAKFELPMGYLIDAVSGARYRYPSSVTVEMITQK
jgi:hypothetical protein